MADESTHKKPPSDDDIYLSQRVNNITRYVVEEFIPEYAKNSRMDLLMKYVESYRHQREHLLSKGETKAVDMLDDYVAETTKNLDYIPLEGMNHPVSQRFQLEGHLNQPPPSLSMMKNMYLTEECSAQSMRRFYDDMLKEAKSVGADISGFVERFKKAKEVYGYEFKH